MSYKENKENGTFECKVCKLIKDSYVEILKHRHYTVKEWKRLDTNNVRQVGDKQYFLNMQEVLCKKYEIILLDHKTKKEKLFQVIDKFSVDNLNKGIDKFNRGVEQFSKVVAEPKKSKRKTKRKKIKEDDYTFLTNRKVKFF